MDLSGPGIDVKFKEERKKKKMQTHIRSDQTALIRVQHGDNLGRSWCVRVCVCALFGTQMEDNNVARGKSSLVCVL
jgi:hypothetical protein